MRPNLAMLLLVVGCAAASPAPSPAKDATRQQITILYDAFGKPSQMEKDWGFAALIEICVQRQPGIRLPFGPQLLLGPGHDGRVASFRLH